MATSTQEWIDELKQISVLELSERIKALEEEFGVSATAVAAAAPGGGGGGDGAAVEEAEEQTAFDVVLLGAGEKKIQVIKVVRAATGGGGRWRPPPLRTCQKRIPCPQRWFAGESEGSFELPNPCPFPQAKPCSP
jgi:ribosomal protein L7/L12